MQSYASYHTDLNRLRSIRSSQATASRKVRSRYLTMVKVFIALIGLLLLCGLVTGITAFIVGNVRNSSISNNPATATNTISSATMNITITTLQTTNITNSSATSSMTSSSSTTSTTGTTTTTATTTTSSTTSRTTTTTTSSTTSRTTTTTTTTSTSSTSTTSTTSTSTATTTLTTTTTPVASVYALNIPTCATWNPNGITVAGNSNGSFGSNLRSLYFPVGIFVDDNDVLYIADRDNRRVMRFNPNSTIGIAVAGNGTAGSAPNLLGGLRGIAVDRYGAIIVADSDNYRIQKFLPNSTVGITIASNTSSNLIGHIRDLNIDVNNNIYVGDMNYNHILKYTPSSSIGIVVAGSGIAGSARNQLNIPGGHCMDSNGTLYVADCANHRVLKYISGSLNGILVAGVNSTSGSALNLLNVPISVVVDNHGYIYVAEQGNHRVTRWTTNYSAGGTCIIGCTGTAGTAANQLQGPRDLKFDRHGNIYVTDHGNHRIQKFLIQLPTSTCPTTTG